MSFFNVILGLAKTNQSMAGSAHKHCYDVFFHSSDLVYVNTTHFSLARRFFKKLALKWVGLFFY